METEKKSVAGNYKLIRNFLFFATKTNWKRSSWRRIEKGEGERRESNKDLTYEQDQRL
jgi:hypothetical protein